MKGIDTLRGEMFEAMETIFRETQDSVRQQTPSDEDSRFLQQAWRQLDFHRRRKIDMSGMSELDVNLVLVCDILDKGFVADEKEGFKWAKYVT